MEQTASQLPNFKLIDQKYYIKNKKLGKGNFAQTYLATLKEDEAQILACKMIEKQTIIEKLKNSSNPEARKEYIIQSLKNEVQLWKKLDHPNIVKFIDFSETTNNIYFFLEYCDSGDLDKFLKNNGKIPEKKALPMLRQIVEGCNFLYENNIFHRDLKPENILIHKSIAKIADFGFSKVIEEEKKDVAVHQTAVGTPFYMAPQILNNQEYSIKCDVWSLGVMFYQILYGFLPWSDQSSINKLAEKIKTEKLSFPPSIPVSIEMQKLISKMLQVSEVDRYSIKQVKEEISHIKE